MYYVYRFLDKKKNVIYVGKSKQDLEQRFRGHKHLPDACYDLTYRIEYIECSTESDMAIKEIYYINRFRHDGTFFNLLDTTAVPASVEFNDKWKQYKGPLGPQFSNSINYIKGYATPKEVKYTKEGLPDRRRPNKEAGVDSYVEGLTSDEVDLLVRHLVDEINEAENNNQEQIRFRNLLMFVLGVNIPHNVNDFLCLKYCDLFDENDQPKALELQLGRFHKDGIVMIPLRDIVRQVLTAYTRKYGLSYAENANDPLFQSRKHQIVSGNAWWKILSLSAKAVGINKNIGAGSLRKTYGLNIFNRSDDKLKALLFLGELWGNVRESKVIRYLNLTDAEIDFDYYLGEAFSLGNMDISTINCLNPQTASTTPQMVSATAQEKASDTVEQSEETIAKTSTKAGAVGRRCKQKVPEQSKTDEDLSHKKNKVRTADVVQPQKPASTAKQCGVNTSEQGKQRISAYEYLGNLLKN